tara:strand:+ start:6791 stop:7138 length:348 start_codon:yes stop_codon:yes gene_type:complete
VGSIPTWWRPFISRVEKFSCNKRKDKKMSTNSECLFVEVEPKRWYLILEDYNAPKDAWDWKEYASAYGPFPSFEGAERYLSRNFANPGGYNKIDYHDDFVPGDTLKELIKNARRQ